METVWVGAIDHKHGTNLYAAITEDGLYAQLADFCREWWATDGPDAGHEVEPPAALATDREIVSAYFHHQTDVGDEWYRAEEVELVDLAHNPDPAEPLNAAERQAIADTGPPIRGDFHPGDEA